MYLCQGQRCYEAATKEEMRQICLSWVWLIIWKVSSFKHHSDEFSQQQLLQSLNTCQNSLHSCNGLLGANVLLELCQGLQYWLHHLLLSGLVRTSFQRQSEERRNTWIIIYQRHLSPPASGVLLLTTGNILFTFFIENAMVLYGIKLHIKITQYTLKCYVIRTYCSPSGLCSIAGSPVSVSFISGNAGTANGTRGPAFSCFCDAWR